MPAPRSLERLRPAREFSREVIDREASPEVRDASTNELVGLGEPRGVGEILDRSVELFLAHAKTFFVWIPLVLLPAQLVGEVFLQVPLQRPDALLASGAVLSVCFSLLTWGIVRVFAVRVVGMGLLGRTESPGASLGATLLALPGLVLLMGVVWAGLTAGALLCLVPAIFAAWLFEPAVTAFALRKSERGPASLGIGAVVPALRRGVRLSRGLPQLTRWGIVTAASLAFAAPFQFDIHEAIGLRLQLAEMLSPELGAVAIAVLNSLLKSVAAGFRAAVVTVLYLDLCARKEGLHLFHGLRTLRSAKGAEAGATEVGASA